MLRTHAHKIKTGLAERGWKKKHLANFDKFKERKYHLLSVATVVFISFGSILMLAAVLAIFSVFPYLYSRVAVVLVGLGMGYFLQQHIAEFDTSAAHYITSGVALILSSFAAVALANRLLEGFSILQVDNPLLVSALYSLAFVFPHLLAKYKNN